MATTKIITEVTDLNATSSTNGLKMPTGGAYSGTPTDGMVRNDTTGSSQGSASTMQHYNGTEWKNYENLLPPPIVFTADYLVVAGGGGSGSNYGGGSGAGGLRTSYGSTSGGGASAESSLSLTGGTAYNVEVGSGGTGAPNGTNVAGNNGSDSTFDTITSIGGGRGYRGGSGSADGSSGGSGGGWAAKPGTGAAGTANQGYKGGNGVGVNNGTAGGGGAAGAGINSYGNYRSGEGGPGLEVNIIGGTGNYYAGGGGGGTYYWNTPVSGGVGGGGAGGVYSTGNTITHQAGNGTPNTGGGGGGSAAGGGQGGNGGSGVVILRYPTADVSSYAVTGTLDTTTDTAYPVANSAYYKLNGDALDSSGNGYNGIASNLSPYAAGRFGQAAVFNGSNSKIDLPVLPLAGGATRSVSAWINTTDNSAMQFIFGSGTQAAYQVFAIHLTATGKVSVSYSASQLDSVGAPIKNNQWHHIAVTFSGGSTANTILYVDGIAQNLTEIGTPGTVNTGNQNYAIGYNSPNPSFPFYFDGSIDQVRIFNSALSAGNVTSLYNESTVNESTDGTDSILQFIGGTGTVTFS